MLQYLINLSIFVPFIIILIVVSIKLSKPNFEGMGIYKYTQIIERTSLNKDTNVFVLKIGNEGCVLVLSPSQVEKIKDISKQEMQEIEYSKKEIKKIKLVKLNESKSKLKKLDLSKLDFKKLGLEKVELKKVDLSELELKKLELKKLELKKLELKNLDFKKLSFKENRDGDIS